MKKIAIFTSIIAFLIYMLIFFSERSSIVRSEMTQEYYKFLKREKILEKQKNIIKKIKQNEILRKTIYYEENMVVLVEKGEFIYYFKERDVYWYFTFNIEKTGYDCYSNNLQYTPWLECKNKISEKDFEYVKKLIKENGLN